jgi:hypothetical protein
MRQSELQTQGNLPSPKLPCGTKKGKKNFFRFPQEQKILLISNSIHALNLIRRSTNVLIVFKKTKANNSLEKHQCWLLTLTPRAKCISRPFNLKVNRHSYTGCGVQRP